MMRAALLLLISLCCGAAVADGRQAQAQLSRLVMQAYDRPEAVLSELRERPVADVPPASLLLAEGQILIEAGQFDAALRVAERLAAMPDGAGLAEVLRALSAERRGLAAEAEAAAQRAWAALAPACPRDAGSRGLGPGCDVRAASVALRLRQRRQQADGALADAAATARHMLALAEAGGDMPLTVMAMSTLAVLSQQLDDPAQARRLLAEAQRLVEDDPLLLGRVKVYEALVAGGRGDAPARLRSLDEALAAARQAGAVRLAANILANLTDLHMHAGRPVQALELARAALPAALQFRDLTLERTLRHNMAVSLIKLRQFDAARRELARSQALGETQRAPLLRAAELREVGEAWAAAGQPREAITVFHAERTLTAQTHARNREAQLQQLRVKFDSEREQANLELLTREKTLQDQQLANRDLARWVGLALGVLLTLSLLLVAAMLMRVRAANEKLKANQRLLRAQSERDPLTDLANRRHFLGVMSEQAKDSFNGALLMIDIDHFKHVNDRYGHGAGDAVICEVGRRISAAVRQEDLVVRWGGEEFLVFAPNVAPEQLQLLAQRVLFSAGGTTVSTEAGPLRVTVSIGFAAFPLAPGQLALHWEQAIDWVDMALYSAKAQGRNRAAGIATVDAQDREALQQIETNFDAACSAERVSLKHIVGPV